MITPEKGADIGVSIFIASSIIIVTPIWQNLIMMVIACVLIYLAVAKEFEPNLLLAIGFGMFIINIPGAYNILYGTYGYTFTGVIDEVQKVL